MIGNNLYYKYGKLFKNIEGKRFSIKLYEVTERNVKWFKLKDRINGRNEYEDFKAGTYVKLIDKTAFFENIVMSNTPMEYKTNKEFIDNATGDVLIAGLGLGLIILCIQDKKEVKSITVIEKYKEIIDIVCPQISLNKKVKIINEDIFQYEPNKDKFDSIYFDIWNNVCGDNYKDIKKLNRKFRKNLNKENKLSFISSWRLSDFKRLSKE